MAKLTPPLKTRGIYTLRAPFPDLSGQIYQCVAIRSFKDYLDLGESALELVYTPAGLSEVEFQADAAEGANIVTLASATGPTVLVPDTYITKYPDLEYVNYSTIIISASLGPLPDELSLELLQEQVGGVISDVIGVTPVVKIHTAGSTGVITLAEHELLEQARQAAVENRISDRARYLAERAKTELLEQKIRDLEEAIENMP